MNLRLIQEIIRQRRRQLIILATLLGLGVIMFVLRTMVLQTKLVDARREWSAQRLQIKQKALLGKAEQFDVGTRDFSRFAARIPAKKDFARVIGELFEFAENNSLSVGSVNYKPEKAAHGYIEYKINIDVTGTYGGIKSFLADINRADEIMTIDTVGLSKGGKLFEEEVTLRATLTVLFGAEG